MTEYVWKMNLTAHVGGSSKLLYQGCLADDLTAASGRNTSIEAASRKTAASVKKTFSR